MKNTLTLIVSMSVLSLYGQIDELPLIQKLNTAFIVHNEPDEILGDSLRLLVSYTKSHPYTGNSVEIHLFDSSSFEMHFSTDIPKFEVYRGTYEISQDTLILHITFSLSEFPTCRKRYFKIDANKLTSLSNEQGSLLDCDINIESLHTTEEFFYINAK